MTVLYSIGHSTHPIETFVGLLQMHGVTALVDVRSHPYSAEQSGSRRTERSSSRRPTQHDQVSAAHQPR